MDRFDLWGMLLRSPDDGSGAGTAPPDTSAFMGVLSTPGDTPSAQQGADGGGEGGEGDSGGGPPPQPETGAAGASSPPAADPARADTAGEEDRTKALREQVQRFLGTAPQAPQPQPVQAPVAPEPAHAPATASGPARPAYDLEIPDRMLAAISSEDPEQRRQGIKALANGIANRMHQDFTAALTALYRDLSERLPAVAEERSTQAVQMQRIKDDFYGAFPAIKAAVKAMPALEQGVWTQVQQVAKQMGLKEWTPEFRDGVGALLHLNLGIPVPPGAKPPGQTPAKRKPAADHFTTGGSTAGGRPNGAGAATDFLDVLNAGSG